MTPHHLDRLERTLRTMAGELRQLAEDADGAAEKLATPPGGQKHREGVRRFARSELIDTANFSVRWRNRTCILGCTLLFRLMDHLVFHANQYVSYEQLLEVVWGAERSSAAIRSAVFDLRGRLTGSGMSDLAQAIDGSNAGHYALLLRDFTKSARSN